MTKLYDNHGRPIDYIRLAVTDRCNLRCFYCMPENGIKYVAREALLSFEEMERLIRVLAEMGIQKVRITGGEPFVRRDMIDFMERLTKIKGIQKVNLTTNGTVTLQHIDRLKAMGIHSVNLSLDCLDKDRFFQITRRDVFDTVMETFHALLAAGIRTKINAVVMEGQNIQDIIPMVKLAKNYPVDVRFIEEMPFNGGDAHYVNLKWNYQEILNHIQVAFPTLTKIKDEPHSTSLNYKIDDFLGTIGVIPAYSRTFCGTCNRIRLTPTGLLKTCLYDDGVFNIRDIMRAGASDAQIKTTFLDALGNRAKNGFEAEKRRSNNLPVSESMATIGG